MKSRPTTPFTTPNPKNIFPSKYYRRREQHTWAQSLGVIFVTSPN
jgi:hypothetical protein